MGLGGYLPDEIIDEIRMSNEIVGVISDYVRLNKQGRNFVGLCPFHNEKTPSFMVSQEKQIFRCFGCGEGGNVFSFIMKRENLNFPEAARVLAQRAGITIPEEDNPEESARLKEVEQAYKVNELAKDFFQYVLKKHDVAKDARSYLENRGIALETIDKFQIGFAPPSWDGLLQFLNKKGFSAAKLEELGLVLPRTKGTPGYYDRFRNRVIFPVGNVKGKIVGFGGRVLDDSLPKYLNSPETLLFNKSHLLYGMDKAADSIRQLDRVIIVEGYLDVITCHQAGITNVVASLGTAFTKEQGKLLLRYTREAVMAYDADAAGVKATMKGWQLLDDVGCRVKVVSIPNGKDPDEFIRKQGPDKFLELVNEKTLSLCDYKTDRAMEKFDIYTLEGKFKIASEVIPSIRNLSNEIEKDEAIMKLAKRLHLSPGAIKAEVDKNARDSRNNWGNRDKITGLRDNNNKFAVPGKAPKGEQDARSRAEESLLIMMLEDRDVLLTVKNAIGVNFSSRQEYLYIINLLNEMLEKELDYQPSALFDGIRDEPAAELLGSLMARDVPSENKTRFIQDCIKTIKEDDLRKKREDLLSKMEEADKMRDQDLRNKLLLEYSKLI
ncbi:MAG: DNA primase [Eubacteriales bacterium]